MKNLFITGNPGVGKTMLIKESIGPFRDQAAGFLTEELREGGERAGFVIRTLEPRPREVLLAKKGLKSPAKVGKYGVDLAALDVAAETLRTPAGKILVVDEIGSMEVLSDGFRQALLAALQAPRPVLATVRHRSQPFTDHVKKMADGRLLHLTRENYLEVKDEVRRWIEEALRG